MLQFERSLVDRVGPPGCAARETAAANVAALEWVLGVVAPSPAPRIWPGDGLIPPGYANHDPHLWATRYGETYRRRPS